VTGHDELARIVAERELDVGDLIRQAEDDARTEVGEALRRLFADDLMRRVGERLGGRPLVALAGVADGVRPLVLELQPGDLENEARLEGLVRAHNELLLEALQEGGVVPFRFGTTFPDGAALEGWLERHRTALAGELDRLRDKAEWSVEPVGRMPDVDAAEYLGARLATTVRPGLRERLAAASEEAAGNAYLVAADRQDDFATAVSELETEGYELRVTGPWPPYSFARLP
jgi:hypothetical protein